MKKLLIILLLLISLVAQAANYYVSTSGIDAVGRGTIGTPWKTLAYACQQLTTGTHTINVGAGTFAENVQIPVSPNISIAGAGYNSTTITTNFNGVFLYLFSGYENGPGNQSIHDIAFNGNWNGSTGGRTAIEVRRRGGVNVYNCKFDNFYECATYFAGTAGWWGYYDDADRRRIYYVAYEGTYAQGNTFHDNLVTSCSRTIPEATGNWNNTGSLMIQNQKDLLIYNNTFTALRADGYNGMPLKGVGGMFKGMKIYNNNFNHQSASNEVAFAIELWYTRGGCEIYNNNLSDAIDLWRAVKSEYPYSMKVYNNTFGRDAPVSWETLALTIEFECADVYFYNNLVKNTREGVVMSTDDDVPSPPSRTERVYIYYNIFQNVIYPIFTYTQAPNTYLVFDNIHIYNNVIKASGQWGILLPQDQVGTTCTNYFIKNNIVTGATTAPVFMRETINNFQVMNNIFWANGNANNVRLETTPTNYTGEPNIRQDPLFINAGAGNFHLNSNSPAKDKGLHIPLTFITTDYDDIPIGSLPEIGAFELEGYVTPVVPTVTTTAITDIMLITATGGGNVVDDGGASVLARGVVWDITTGPTLSDNVVTSGSGLGTFTSSLTGLSQATTYYVKAYATNSAGTAYGNEVTFQTGPPEQATATTGTPIRTSDTTATGVGSIISAGGGTIIARGVAWSVSADPTLADDFAIAAAGGLGEYTAAMTGLVGTIYYVRAWATNETTTVYGDNVLLDMREGQLLRGAGGTLIRDANGNLIRVGGTSNLTYPDNWYFVSNTGDNSNTGLLPSQGWKTLSYACANVSAPGSVINVSAGTFIEITPCILAPGVSIQGAGISTIIRGGYAGNGDRRQSLISLHSTPEGTDGNQSISNLYLDGDLTTLYAIYVQCRSNVIIHDCTIIDFLNDGVTFTAKVSDAVAAPTIFATGNKFYNNTVTNSSLYSGYGRGSLQIGGQDSMLVYNNSMTQTQRATGSNGYVVKYYAGGYNEALKIYDNTIIGQPFDGATYGFSMELWHVMGGTEIYNNIIYPSIDFGTETKGAYDYTMSIHHNTFGPDVRNIAHDDIGIQPEDTFHDVLIYSNYFKNMRRGVAVISAGGAIADNLYIYNNIFYKTQVTAFLISGAGSTTIDNVNIWNNTCYAGDQSINPVGLPNGATATNFSIKNNILYGNGQMGIYTSQYEGASGTLVGLDISNNVIYNNGSLNNVVWDGITPTSLTNDGGIKSDPLFVSTLDFNLQTGSPAINTGVDVGLTEDFEGNPIVGLPDLGAIEKQ